MSEEENIWKTLYLELSELNIKSGLFWFNTLQKQSGEWGTLFESQREKERSLYSIITNTTERLLELESKLKAIGDLIDSHYPHTPEWGEFCWDLEVILGRHGDVENE